MFATFLFLGSAFVSAVLLFTMVYFVIMFSDLEMDYVNPIDLCRRLNMFVLPEMAVHLTLTLVFLLTFNLMPFLINLPLVLYNASRVKDHKHPFEPTDIFKQMAYRKQESLIKVGFYLLTFFYYLFRMVGSLIASI